MKLVTQSPLAISLTSILIRAFPLAHVVHRVLAEFSQGTGDMKTPHHRVNKPPLVEVPVYTQFLYSPSVNGPSEDA